MCITDLDPGGAEKALARIALGLHALRRPPESAPPPAAPRKPGRGQAELKLPPARPWDVTVYCLGPRGELAGLLEQGGIRVECFGAKSIFDRGATNWLAGHLRRQQPAALLSFLFHANLISRWAARRAKTPLVISGHRVAEKQKRWHLWLDRWTRSLAQHHVCVSRGVADHIRDRVGIPESRITVIPNGVEVPQPLPEPADLEREFGIPRSQRVILAAGRLHPQKGFLTLLEAFSQLSRQQEDLRLLIAGEGEQRTELEAAIVRLKLKEQVVLPGRRNDLLAIMRAADVLALSSAWEGMPNVVLEAMSVGLPVVASSVEGISELIEPGRTGLVVTPADATALAQGLAELLDDSRLARDLSAAAQAIIEKRFTWSSVIGEYDALLRRLIG